MPDLPWLRMLYIYPSPLTLRMVDVMAEHDALLPYLDMPIQHADPTVLRNMNRPSDITMTRRLIDHARARMPDVVMRTTLIVGYPGETDQQFQTLLDFVRGAGVRPRRGLHLLAGAGHEGGHARSARGAGTRRRGAPQRDHGGAAGDLAAQEPGAGGHRRCRS